MERKKIPKNSKPKANCVISVCLPCDTESHIVTVRPTVRTSSTDRVVHINVNHGWKSSGEKEMFPGYWYRVLWHWFSEFCTSEYLGCGYKYVLMYMCTELSRVTGMQRLCCDLVTESKFWLLLSTSISWFVLSGFHTSSTSEATSTRNIPQGFPAKWLILTRVMFYATFVSGIYLNLTPYYNMVITNFTIWYLSIYTVVRKPQCTWQLLSEYNLEKGIEFKHLINNQFDFHDKWSEWNTINFQEHQQEGVESMIKLQNETENIVGEKYEETSNSGEVLSFDFLPSSKYRVDTEVKSGSYGNNITINIVLAVSGRA